jgi:hypothetical protein
MITNVQRVETGMNGVTTLVTTSNVRIDLSAQATADLVYHFHAVAQSAVARSLPTPNSRPATVEVVETTKQFKNASVCVRYNSTEKRITVDDLTD